MCLWGTVIQIKKEHADPVLYRGNFVTNTGGYIHYIAAGSTGDLVERSEARICGVVTGFYAYSNVSGGQTQSVQLVGMFDLPENRR